jgi:hypothetical protein
VQAAAVAERAGLLKARGPEHRPQESKHPPGPLLHD